MRYYYIFGPVPSRRLGSSLGVDLLPMKTCSLDCAYCECGKTTTLTVERAEYVPTAEVIAEIDHFMKSGVEHPNYITFSGSGEPTLHTGIGTIIRHIKEQYPGQKTALLTNSTLLSREDVRNDIYQADLIVPSLDAVSSEVFHKILGPHLSLTPEKIIEGIKLLKNGFSGKLVMEIFIVPGINDTDSELSLLRKALEEIAPEAIQINHLDRVGAYSWVKPITQEIIDRVLAAFTGLPVEPVAVRYSDKDRPVASRKKK